MSAQLSLRDLLKKKAHIVVALGGNALLRRGQPMSMSLQRKNIATGMKNLAPLLAKHTATIIHGNGPQVGLLALMGASYQRETGVEQMRLDVLDAETEGMIGYMIEQELYNLIPPDRGMATILTQIIVDPNDPAFANPTKFIGPVYNEIDVKTVKGTVKRDGDYFRRVVPSPQPVRMLEPQTKVMRLLSANDTIVICAGGGGIPVEVKGNRLEGVEAVIDKDKAAAMIGSSLRADGLLILTDVPAVAQSYGTSKEKWIRSVSPDKLRELSTEGYFPEGSMGPKVDSAIQFVCNCPDCWAVIGSLDEVGKVLEGVAGTLVTTMNGPHHLEWYE